MKRWIAFLLCLLLALSLAACGSDKSDKPDKKPTQISVKPTTETEDTAPTGGSTAPTEGESTAPTGTAPTGSVATDSSASATGSTGSTTKPTTTTTTEPAPSGVTVPIGTRPPTTSTTTRPTASATGGTTTGSTGTTTTTSTTTTTTTKPTQPPEEQLYLVLPAIGSDIDVTKKKDRIRVSATAAWFNEDGTIGVSLTFKNVSSNWITEETDYILYTCYDKDGNIIETVKLSIGVIDTKKNFEREYTFAVPAHTAEVRITGSKITYWTEWA